RGGAEPDGGTCGADENAVAPSEARQRVAGPRDVVPVADVDMRHLVIADGEGPAQVGFELFAERPAADGDQSGGPEGPIEINRLPDIAMPVLADDPNARPGRGRGVQERRARVVEFL